MAKYETKFSIGDVVYVRQEVKEYVRKTCDLCSGTSKVTLNNTAREVRCPDCALGTFSAADTVITVRITSDIVGMVRAEESEKEGIKETYMLKGTGIGSGRIWKEADLFCSRKEAENYDVDRSN